MKLTKERQAAEDELTAASLKEAEVLAKLQQMEKVHADFEAKRAKWEARLAKYEADKETLEEEEKKLAEEKEANAALIAKSEENEVRNRGFLLCVCRDSPRMLVPCSFSCRTCSFS